MYKKSRIASQQCKLIVHYIGCTRPYLNLTFHLCTSFLAYHLTSRLAKLTLAAQNTIYRLTYRPSHVSTLPCELANYHISGKRNSNLSLWTLRDAETLLLLRSRFSLEARVKSQIETSTLMSVHYIRKRVLSFYAIHSALHTTQGTILES